MPDTLLQPLRLPAELASGNWDFLNEFPCIETLARCRSSFLLQLKERKGCNTGDYWPDPKLREIAETVADVLHEHTGRKFALLPDDELRALWCLPELDDMVPIAIVETIGDIFQCELLEKINNLKTAQDLVKSIIQLRYAKGVHFVN